MRAKSGKGARALLSWRAAAVFCLMIAVLAVPAIAFADVPTSTTNAVPNYLGQPAVIIITSTAAADNMGVATSTIAWGVDGSALTTSPLRSINATTVTTTASVSAGLGAHTLYYKATDNIGDVEATKSVTFNIRYSDVTAPTNSSNLLAVPNIYAYPAVVTSRYPHSRASTTSSTRPCPRSFLRVRPARR
jgi:hypothetical protein